MGVDRLKSKAKDIKGKIERKAGELSGDRSQQLKGFAKHVEGKTREAFGKMKDAGRKTVQEIREKGRETIHKLRDEKRHPSSVQPQRDPQSPGNDVVPKHDDDIGEKIA